MTGNIAEQKNSMIDLKNEIICKTGLIEVN